MSLFMKAMIPGKHDALKTGYNKQKMVRSELFVITEFDYSSTTHEDNLFDVCFCNLNTFYLSSFQVLFGHTKIYLNK
jgi:hypothetical protein